MRRVAADRLPFRRRGWLRRKRRPLDEASLRRYFVEERQLLNEVLAASRHYLQDQYLCYDLLPGSFRHVGIEPGPEPRGRS